MLPRCGISVNQPHLLVLISSLARFAAFYQLQGWFLVQRTVHQSRRDRRPLVTLPRGVNDLSLLVDQGAVLLGAVKLYAGDRLFALKQECRVVRSNLHADQIVLDERPVLHRGHVAFAFADAVEASGARQPIRWCDLVPGLSFGPRLELGLALVVAHLMQRVR